MEKSVPHSWSRPSLSLQFQNGNSDNDFNTIKDSVFVSCKLMYSILLSEGRNLKESIPTDHLDL